MSPAAKRVVGGLLVVLALLVAAVTIRIPMGPSVRELQSQIDQALPKGSSRERVADFVRRSAMGEGIYLDRERMINAMVRGVSKGLLMETSLYIRFRFDEKGQLESYTVEEVSTGL